MQGRTTARARVLAVGLDPGELEDATVELSDDVLGAIARLADGGIDVVLLALDLPDAEGTDAVSEVRELDPDVPVIAVADAGLAERAIDAGAGDVVPVDATPDALSRAVRSAVAVHALRTELRRRRIDDEETGLMNGTGFHLFAAHHVALAARTGIPFVLVTVGLDAADEEAPADRSVAETADVLRAAVREADVLARVGPGAFGVLLTGEAAGAESLVLARVVDAVAQHNARAGRTGGLTLSIGAATYDPKRPTTLDELIAAAEPRSHGARGEP
jgi:diguanylate cyclase (GGDEF)-like protein